MAWILGVFVMSHLSPAYVSGSHLIRLVAVYFPLESVTKYF